MRVDVNTVATDLDAVSMNAQEFFGDPTQAQLNWKPDDKSWSVAQCLDHLIATHNQYLPLFKRMAAGEAKPTFWEKTSPLSGFFGRYLIKSLDPANLKKIKA